MCGVGLRFGIFILLPMPFGFRHGHGVFGRFGGAPGDRCGGIHFMVITRRIADIMLSPIIIAWSGPGVSILPFERLLLLSVRVINLLS
jgi:hypothetical protein